MNPSKAMAALGRRRRLRFCGGFLALAALPALLQATEVTLNMEPTAQGFAFSLVGSLEGHSWILQHSENGQDWQDVRGFAPSGTAQVDRRDLLGQGGAQGFFRARPTEISDPGYATFVEQRSLWNRSERPNYQYELRQNFGSIASKHLITVTEGVVTSSEVIEVIPPFFDPPTAPTIDELFDRLANAFARDAALINVTWDAERGYPRTAYIDISELIADEEQGWSIERFTPEE